MMHLIPSTRTAPPRPPRRTAIIARQSSPIKQSSTHGGCRGRGSARSSAGNVSVQRPLAYAPPPRLYGFKLAAALLRICLDRSSEDGSRACVTMRPASGDRSSLDLPCCVFSHMHRANAPRAGASARAATTHAAAVEQRGIAGRRMMRGLTPVAVALSTSERPTARRS